MKELLQRLSALDESASAALKVITFFDTLLTRRAGLEPFVRGAAVLSGRPAGFGHPLHQLWLRLDPSGTVLPPITDLTAALAWPHLELSDGSGALVWIEREGEPSVNDPLILERLAAGLRLTLERVSPIDLDDAGALELLVSPSSTDDVRRKAARRLRLPVDRPLRVVVGRTLDSSAVGARSATMESRFGAVRVGVIEASDAVPERCGVGSAVSLRHLPQSWDEALLAARLVSRLEPVVRWDDLGVLGPVVDATHEALREHPDVARVGAVLGHAWGQETLAALAMCDSMRAAAQVLGVHHSTVQARAVEVERLLGFDPGTPAGRVRMSLALAIHQAGHVKSPDFVDGSVSGQRGRSGS